MVISEDTMYAILPRRVNLFSLSGQLSTTDTTLLRRLEGIALLSRVSLLTLGPSLFSQGTLPRHRRSGSWRQCGPSGHFYLPTLPRSSLTKQTSSKYTLFKSPRSRLAFYRHLNRGSFGKLCQT